MSAWRGTLVRLELCQHTKQLVEKLRKAGEAAQRQFQDKVEADFSGGNTNEVSKGPLQFDRF